MESWSKLFTRLWCLPRKSFAQIKACYMQKIAASWNPSKGERLYLKYEGKLVLDESKVSCFRKRRLTLTAHISNDRRQKIEQEWNRIAREAGAAEIEFVNEIDDDEVPPTVGRLFKYLEAEYLFEMGVEPQISRLVRCRCKGGLCASGCHSPSNAHMYNSLVRVDIKHFAPKGLVYPGVSELLECNPRCTCDPDYCSNRRVQRPRQIKIQIFKTEKRGWGVRAKVDTVKGSILGIYTGLIIRRQDVQNLLISTYSFDLDAMESPEEPPENSYTVDAFGCGNWTRFINHSCQPNLKIIPAVYDSMPEDNLPYLAFVSTKDIAAYTELSFDYCPRRQEEWEQQKYKTKGTVKRKRAKTETRCFCGSTNCRGFL
ncbi:hypothetical protein K438DRAFT_15865 [Mycena galopus ATCC 62051]|nr:hypothetical protein K438DRAFT_15865 [Mycena galopus ATCC 62051]